MTVGIAGGYIPVDSFHRNGPRRDGKKGKSRKSAKRVARPIVGQWIIDEWRQHTGLDSVWLGINAWNGDLTETEAEALIEACDKIRKVGETAFWDAFWKGYEKDFQQA